MELTIAKKDIQNGMDVAKRTLGRKQDDVQMKCRPNSISLLAKKTYPFVTGKDVPEGMCISEFPAYSSEGEGVSCTVNVRGLEKKIKSLDGSEITFSFQEERLLISNQKKKSLELPISGVGSVASESAMPDWPLAEKAPDLMHALHQMKDVLDKEEEGELPHWLQLTPEGLSYYSTTLYVHVPFANDILPENKQSCALSLQAIKAMLTTFKGSVPEKLGVVQFGKADALVAKKGAHTFLMLTDIFQRFPSYPRTDDIVEEETFEWKTEEVQAAMKTVTNSDHPYVIVHGLSEKEAEVRFTGKEEAAFTIRSVQQVPRFKMATERFKKMMQLAGDEIVLEVFSTSGETTAKRLVYRSPEITIHTALREEAPGY